MELNKREEVLKKLNDTLQELYKLKDYDYIVADNEYIYTELVEIAIKAIHGIFIWIKEYD